YIMTYFSVDYPDLLKEIDTPPIILYCKGNVKLLNSPCVGVVGTRRATKYGKEVTYDMVKDIASSGITVVSGLADGIDEVAHNATLDVKGKTIAVIASGFNYIYPSANQPLYNKILSNGGLVVTEYKMNEKPQSYNFPVRNRIIAGLSKAVIVAEATEKSGSMHTKNYALDYGREVFAIPGRVTDIYSNGCNKLIKNGQATMLLSSKDVVDFYGIELQSNKENKVLQLSLEESCVYELLKTGEMHYNELLTASGLEPRKLNTLLMRLEINGVIKKLAGNVYSIF
ncbi:MAG: DNA-processing protein DprA, partial [Clostridia bacterium]|nr:DNA-processing protein DprA [Clostridia bacterium]